MELVRLRHLRKFPSSFYNVQVSWDYLKDCLEHYEKSHGIELDPDFQRGYVWTKKQKIEYVEYIVKGGFSGKDIFWNHASWMGDFNDSDHLQLVDGKQRLSAVLDFLDNKLKIFNKYYLKDLWDGQEENVINFDLYFNFHINNLKTKKEVVEWYIAMNTGGSVHTEKDLKPAYEILKGL